MGKDKIGTLYAFGSNVFANGSKIEDTTGIDNNTFVSTGLQSAVRIEFKEDNGTCLIHVKDFKVGKGYGDTASCQHSIGTTHADSQMQNSVYHFNVSPQQTEVTVLSGLVKLALHADPSQTVNVNSGEEAIVTVNAIVGPRPVSIDEVNRRIRWRDKYTFSTREVDWATVGAVAVGVAAIGVGVALGVGGGNNHPPSSPSPRTPNDPSPTPTPKNAPPPTIPDSTVDYGQAVPAPSVHPLK
ncbi:MAG: hypothetical protein HOP02_03170 [Methylococcaceae bacterium]|nr:hypothetical protein [Methylococcaceae bacterium]